VRYSNKHSHTLYRLYPDIAVCKENSSPITGRNHSALLSMSILAVGDEQTDIMSHRAAHLAVSSSAAHPEFAYPRHPTASSPYISHGDFMMLVRLLSVNGSTVTLTGNLARRAYFRSRAPIERARRPPGHSVSSRS
jgi:hypothetical protein